MTELYKTKDSYKWVVLAISFLLMLTFAISLQSLPPIFDQITKDIPFSNSQAGMLMGAYGIPGIFISILVSLSAKKFDPKKLIIFGLLIMIMGLIAFSRSESFISLLKYRFVTGIGATFVVVLAPLLVTMFFDQKNIGIAMGIFNIAVPFGIVLAMNLFGIVGALVAWRTIILGVAVFLGVVLAVNLFALKLPSKLPNKVPNKLSNKVPNSLPNSKDTKNPQGSQWQVHKKFRVSLSLWLLAVIWTLASFQLLAYVTFGPQHFQSVGMSVQRAGLLTSLIMVIPILLSPLVGLIIDKTGWGKQLLLMGSIIIAASFLLIIKSSIFLPLWATTIGIGYTPISIFVFSFLPQIVEPQQIGMGLGVLTIAGNIGMIMGPATFGFILDITAGKFYIGFIILSLISLGIIFALFGIKNKRGK